MWRKLQGKDWSFATKVGALVAAASVLPLVIQGTLALSSEEKHAAMDMERLLSARAEQVVHDFDAAHRNYLTSASRIARLQVTKSYCGGDAEGQRERLVTVFKTFPASDADIRGVSILGPTGRVTASSDDAIVGVDLSFRRVVRSALSGSSVISNVYLSHPLSGSVPTVAYLAPVMNPAGRVACVVGVFVNPDLLWRILRGFNDLAGQGSYAVIYDIYGIPVAHSLSNELLYHPAGPMDPSERDRMTDERRFGPDTSKLLADVRPIPEHFSRATAASVAPRMFASRTADGEADYGVAVRMTSAAWTVFYMTPAVNLAAKRDEMRSQAAAIGTLMLLLALAAAAIFSDRTLRPIRSLRDATRSVTSGNTAARATVFEHDEVGELAESFNAMASQLETQEKTVRKANQELQERVRERTGLLQAAVRQRDELAQSNRDLEAFSSSVSHDLRAPLHAVRAFSEVLAQRHAQGLNDEGKQFLGSIQAATEQMEELIQAMLRLASVAQKPLKIETVPLEPLVREVVEQMVAGGIAHASSVRIGNLPTIECDRTLMQQVFHNLLANACKFTSQVEPRIEVGSREENGESVLFVRDNGAGFDMAHGDQLFQPFRRLHSTAEFPGLGIGLSIVRRIAERHGGRIWAESRPGEGACFWIAMPNPSAASRAEG